MSEKLCLQWNEFKENIHTAFGRLREDNKFSDVTLVCRDGQQMEAHKVILAVSSPFFEKILQTNKHPHPLIYFKGFHSQDFVAILDFLYTGEANVNQEDLDSFLEIADELKLKGFTNRSSIDGLKEEEKYSNLKPESRLGTSYKDISNAPLPNVNAVEKASKAVSLPDQFDGDLQALDKKVKSMIVKSQNIIPRIRSDGTPRLETAFVCKVCGKEGRSSIIVNHIEVNHLAGISIPCDYCGRTFGTRKNLVKHKSKNHRISNNSKNPK